MLKKVLMLFAVVFLLPVVSFASYPLFQYPNVPTFNEQKANGAFRIYVQKDGQWEYVGQLRYDKYFRQRTLDISGHAVRGKTVKIRIEKDGGGLAHIDSVLFNAKPPLRASGTEAELKKFAKDDFDVIDASGKGLDFEFAAEEGKAIVSLTARIEEAVISKTPFQYPTVNLYKEIGHDSEFYTYKIEKDIKNKERLIFKEYSLTGSGHPSGYTYGWVSNDKDNLYVTIDFTPDNTMDGDKDYAKVYVKAGKMLREFKVTTEEERWGKAYFTYTKNASYEHKLYRFQIPLAEIGIKEEGVKEIQVAFSAYGTAAPPPGGAFGTTPRRYLVAYDRSGDIYGQLVGEDGTAIGPEFVISNATNDQYWPSVAYNPSTNQFLVVWTDNRSGSNADIYGQIVNSNGSLSGGNFVISNATNNQYLPSVAYNPSTNQFLVVWYDYRSGSNADIYGQLVNADGSLSGGNFVISNAGDDQVLPSVAYNPSTNQFLVVWQDHLGTSIDIYGQLVNANGTLSGTNFVISNATDWQGSPSVAYNPSTNQFLVVWNDSRNGNDDIYGQLVNSDGSLVGSNFLVQSNAIVPHAMANTFCPNYLIAFLGSGGYSWTLYGTPCQQQVAVPTMTEWGMIIFMVLAGLGGGYYLRKRGMVN